MAPNTQPIFVRSANNSEQTFVAIDGTAPKDLTIAGPEGSKVFAINVTSDDAAAVEMQVFLHDGTSAYLLGTVPVPALAGTDGVVPAVNLLDGAFIAGLDGDGELFIAFGYRMQVAPMAAVTASALVTVLGFGGDY